MSDTYKECLMKYCGKEPLPHCCTVLECEIESMEPDKDGGIESTYFFSINDTEIGSISIYEEKRTVNIFGVYIEPEYRGKGYAREMMYSVLEDIIPGGRQILLQVADNNKPAFGLYTGCGFKVIDFVEMSTTQD